MVWTAQNRERYDRRGQRYPSDLTNEEWNVLEPLLPVPQGSGRPRLHLLREIMNGIRYVLRYGIPWDAMPKDLPPSSICYDYSRLLSDGGHMERINHHLVMADREKAGREASPTMAIIDAQSVKCDAPQGERGYDAGKKVLGRKRHIAVDSGGRLLAGDDHRRQRPGPERRNPAGEAAGAPVSMDQDRRRRWRLQDTLHRGRPGDRKSCRRGRQTTRFRQRLRALAQTMESRANHRGVDDLAPA